MTPFLSFLTGFGSAIPSGIPVLSSPVPVYAVLPILPDAVYSWLALTSPLRLLRCGGMAVVAGICCTGSPCKASSLIGWFSLTSGREHPANKQFIPVLYFFEWSSSSWSFSHSSYDWRGIFLKISLYPFSAPPFPIRTLFTVFMLLTLYFPWLIIPFMSSRLSGSGGIFEIFSDHLIGPHMVRGSRIGLYDGRCSCLHFYIPLFEHAGFVKGLCPLLVCAGQPLSSWLVIIMIHFDSSARLTWPYHCLTHLNRGGGGGGSQFTLWFITCSLSSGLLEIFGISTNSSSL